MSGNNSVGDHVHNNLYGNIGSYNKIEYLTVDEKIELDELRSKVKIYENICNPAKYKAIWYSAFYSGKLAEQMGETTVADMERFYQEDINEIIQEELSSLDLSEESDGEFTEQD